MLFILANLNYHLGQCVSQLFSKLAEQISSSIRHICFRHNINCQKCKEQGYQISMKVLEELPLIRNLLAKDVKTAYERDPAAKSYDEIIFSYPSIYAIPVYRVANLLYSYHGSMLPLMRMQ